ncbi:hypothetical protein ASPFODRAFT_53613 [Aspergillus luchuensis CBS 106.47]|uniref:Uncharacterized protein n=1 Tax=Aspergillus luchuensis (strain CBS 106.47) TaxID=1137211 RepID=A0A1M3T0H7_ASPLC|nr:hypothetical protein ASPFODRAFT_53613 [Aspergillus luchuensis CBS 106.47]
MKIIFWYVGQGPLRTIQGGKSSGQFFSFASHVAQAIAFTYSMQDLRPKEVE